MCSFVMGKKSKCFLVRVSDRSLDKTAVWLIFRRRALGIGLPLFVSKIPHIALFFFFFLS